MGELLGLSWDNYKESITGHLKSLIQDEEFVDVNLTHNNNSIATDKYRLIFDYSGITAVFCDEIPNDPKWIKRLIYPYLRLVSCFFLLILIGIYFSKKLLKKSHYNLLMVNCSAMMFVAQSLAAYNELAYSERWK